jgi:hypothetical protein
LTFWLVEEDEEKAPLGNRQQQLEKRYAGETGSVV